MAVPYTHECDFTKNGTAYLSLWRYDYGQRVELIGDNIDETMKVQWHYTGVSDVDIRDITKETTHYYALIPNDALQQADKVTGYIYVISGSVANTVYKIEIDIRNRRSTLDDTSTDGLPSPYPEHDLGNSGTAMTVDWTKGDKYKVTMTGNCTFTFIAPTKAGHYQLRIINDGTAGRTVTLPPMLTQSGSALSFTSLANAIDIVNIYYDGTDYYAMLSTDWKLPS